MTLPTIRVLPLTIAAGALLLAVETGSLWTTVSLLFVASPAHAEQAKAAKDAKPADKTAKDGADSHGMGKHADAADQGEDKDPLANFTPQELQVLSDLAKRREKLDERDAALTAREALVDAAEKRMKSRVAELQDLRSSIEALIHKYDAQQTKELKSVVKIYETMKPKDAAAILEKLDMPTLLSIVDAMKERKTSAILAAMTPKRAREVTAEMARKKAIDLSRMKDAGASG